MTFAATVLTLYPEMFPGPLGVSLAGRALKDGVWSLDAVQIRDFATDKHRTVDDTPAGGGAGMVLRCDVLAAALDSILPGTWRGTADVVGGGGAPSVARGEGEVADQARVPPPQPAAVGPPAAARVRSRDRTASEISWRPP